MQTIEVRHDTQDNGAADDDVAARLAELRERRAAAEAKRAELETLTPVEELAKEERALADAEAINRAIQEHGRVGLKIDVLQTALGAVILRRCSAARYKRFQDIGEYEAEKCEQLVRPNVIYPTLTEFDRMCEEQPAILFRCTNALGRLAGVRKEDIEKK